MTTETREGAAIMAPLRVLIAGGGVAALEAALALRNLAGERVAIELLAPGPDFVNRPVTVRNPFASVDTPRLPLDRLTDLGITVHPEALAAVNADRHQARTHDGAVLSYDRLIVAIGAHAVQSVAGATHFAGPRDAGAIEHLLRVVARDPERTLTFALAAGVTWPVPFYELALLSAGGLARRGVETARIMLVTHEQRPLELFGPTASEAMARLLHESHIEVTVATAPEAVFEGAIRVSSGDLVPAGDVVAVPALQGRPVGGLDHDADGFLRIDTHARVDGVEHVFAAGDITDGPVKQGGLAAQQADAAALWIAAEAGAPIDATPPPAVLRAVLFTPDGELHLRAPLGKPERGEVSWSPLWHPSGKLAGRYLAGYLADGNPGDELVDRAARTATV
jgi:sulfide:quinone oxidoreductase